LQETFSDTLAFAERWRTGILATPAATFDSTAQTQVTGSVLTIVPATRKDGAHFSGYVSVATFDLRAVSIAVELRRATTNGAATIFAAATDSNNWLGFRIEAGTLSIESHTGGKAASRKRGYDPAQHRFLRLRSSNIAEVVVWETSADGKNWNPEYVETAAIDLSHLRIALSAGTTKRIESPGTAVFDNVIVEMMP